jgi:hypothetical protein
VQQNFLALALQAEAERSPGLQAEAVVVAADLASLGQLQHCQIPSKRSNGEMLH